MRLALTTRRALLLGFAGVAACDVAQVAMDPTFPGIVQTWNFPASEMSIAVSELLPAGVDTNATKTAFLVNVPQVGFNRRLGGYCGVCQVLNGTTAPKPPFIISPDTGAGTSLPANVQSAVVLGAKLTYNITNGLSFDPLRVNPSNLNNPQGFLVIVIRSGSFVLARDSVNGKTDTMPPGKTLTRVLQPCAQVPAGTPCFGSGLVTGGITVDLLLNSPTGEPTLINSLGQLAASATLDSLEVAAVTIQIPNSSMDSPADTLPSSLPSDMIDRLLESRLEMMVTNPFGVGGSVNVTFNVKPGVTISKTLSLPTSSEPELETISFTSSEIKQIIEGGGEDKPTTFSISGGVSSSTPVTVTPRQVITISNRLVIKVRAGGKSE
jgi:hypothetical protein